MSADYGFPGFCDACMGGYHTVDPSCLTPQCGVCIAPVWDWYIFRMLRRELDSRARNPAVNENVMRRLIVVLHGWDDFLYVRIVCQPLLHNFRAISQIVRSRTCELAYRVDGAVEMMMVFQIEGILLTICSSPLNH